MLSLHLTALTLLFALEATAWPMRQLFERDDNSTTSSGGEFSSDSPSDDTSGMDLAMKAFAFNFGYTALSANSSCGGLGYGCIEDDAYHCVDETWSMALDCKSQSKKCYAIPGDELADDPIVACKSFSEVYDLFTELLDDCALGDPSGQAALFGYFYDMSDSEGNTSTTITDSEMSMMTTTPVMVTTPTVMSSEGAQTTGVQTGTEPDMTCTATSAGAPQAASTGAFPTATIPASTSMSAATTIASDGSSTTATTIV